jgi:beta-galactosidase
MRRLLALLILAGLLVCAFTAPPAAGQSRRLLPMDSNWKFHLGDAQGAQAAAFDDGGWRTLNVPHDWSIEGPFDPNSPTGPGGGYLPGGVGWYRKRFTLPAEDARRRVFIDFDGVMAHSDVWINGFHLGRRPYGYVSFRYELTGHLAFSGSKPNLLAVRADNSAQPASRWYTGAGIYRHVRLVVTDPVHIGTWGTFVTTPQIAADQAVVHVRSTVVNQSEAARKVTLRVTLLGPDGRPVQAAEAEAQTVLAGRSIDFHQDLLVKKPLRWDLDHPVLYGALAQVRAGNATLDDEITSFGIREFRFDADTGFRLNGKTFKIKGVCLHHDAGALGAAVPLRAWERRLELLKQFGVNAIRTAHNPVAPEFLDLCDRMGFLVMDEMFDCWTVAKNPYDYHLSFNAWAQTDVRDTVLRDRNHPSIVIYSAGNEIHDTPNAALARRILLSLRDVFHQNDPTRPVSQALFRPNVSHDYDNGLADLLDVIGQNYRENEILAAHRARPERKILGTENGHNRRVWLALRDNPPYAGQFLWTGFDYLGEARRWPAVAAGFGLFDRTGTPRPLAYERQSWWSDRPMVHIARRTAPTIATLGDPGYEPLPQRRPQALCSDWTPRNLEPHEENVEVYSNCEQVELILNGKSLGSQPRSPDDAPRIWRVAFAPGSLKAVGTNGGKSVAMHDLRTAGKPARIVLTADRTVLTPDWNDVAYVTATVADENGVPCPSANDRIAFHLTGPGVIAAIDNGDLISHEPFQASERHAFQGQCIAILRGTAARGRITLTASAPGLTAASLTIDVAW